MYKIGISKEDITSSSTGLQLQGFSDPDQKSTGVRSNLYARAFVIEDDAQKKIGVVIADFWSCTANIKTAVLAKLKSNGTALNFTEANLMIAGTHTHSAPGGYTDYELFNQPRDSKNSALEELYVNGIVKAIETADGKLADGKIYCGKGTVSNVGLNRSIKAYNNNPQTERTAYGSTVDNEMLFLKFMTIENNKEIPIGILNWYAVHPTALGQTNTLISGDIHGEAAQKFEKTIQDDLAITDFVAAFANANCGDISGNVGNDIPDGTNDVAHLTAHVAEVHNTALDIFNSSGLVEITGAIEVWHKRVDMSTVQIKNSDKRTYPYALGLSFAAGSSEDSIPKFKGVFGDTQTVTSQASEGMTTSTQQGIRTEMSLAMSVKFGTKIPAVLEATVTKGHGVKPILFAPEGNQSIAPHIVPIQLLRLGSFAIAGIPGEITTMAGRRLRKSILHTLENRKVADVALGTYANDYAQYITTTEEYNMQHYEGASTPFGPYTLNAFQQEFEALVPHASKKVLCTNDTWWDTWFYCSYKDTNGNLVNLNTGKNVLSYTFTLPWDATSVKVYASFKPGLEAWTNSNTVSLSNFESNQAKSVIFKDDRTLSSTDKVLDKTLYCKNDSLLDVYFYMKYRNADGSTIDKETPSKVVGADNFTIPWDANFVEVYAKYLSWGNWIKTNTKRLADSFSGQTTKVQFQDESVKGL